MVAPVLGLADLADGAGALRLDSEGAVTQPVVVVDLDGIHDWTASVVTEAVAATAARSVVLIGVTSRVLPPQASPLLEALTCTVTSPHKNDQPEIPVTMIEVDDPSTTVDALTRTVDASPHAANTLTGLLRLTAALSPADGLVAESLAYSMLLAGPEFRDWRHNTPRHTPSNSADPVLIVREGSTLRVTLNRPERHNAFGRGIRDGIIEAMQLAELDHSIESVELSGNGKSFCSGGDLDEFGTTPDVASAHLIRLQQSAGYAVHRNAARVKAVLHGACMGAGIEIPAFASRVDARTDSYFQLPELRMGLVPGAGGTVSITKRIGRWRTAYLALSGQPVDVDTALRWGLVDERV